MARNAMEQATSSFVNGDSEPRKEHQPKRFVSPTTFSGGS